VAERGSTAARRLWDVQAALAQELDALRFGAPVTHVYNPLDYARAPARQYFEAWGAGHPEVVLVGMNPGPFGMVQTGVPFGDPTMVRDFLGIDGEVGRPPVEHPKRPITGFTGAHREVSGTRVWGWAKARFETPERFFARFFVLNYCPLAFMEASGKNRTPDKLPAAEREPLFRACDRALARALDALEPRYAVGIGAFAAEQVRRVVAERPLVVGRIHHPSPANPAANRAWVAIVEAELQALGIALA
jgi:single-strand selective monofunctional uracil DNA glycosylase